MAGSAHYALKVLDLFRDINGRRSGILRALTTDFREFCRQCDPEKDEQCLVGHPNGTWEVKPPDMMVPPDLPAPVSCVNFGRNQMPEQEWVAKVTARCDSCLLALAFYVGGCAGFTKSEREMLFQMINGVPTICEAVKDFTKSNDQPGTTMLKKPESCSAVKMSSPRKDESGAAIEDGHNDGSSSYGQSKSSGTYANSSDNDSGAQKDESGTAIEDCYDDGSSSDGQSESTGTYVKSSVDDSGAQKDEIGAAIEDGHMMEVAVMVKVNPLERM